MARREDHLVAVFDSWTQAEAAVDDLRERRIDDDLIGLAIHGQADHGLVKPATEEMLETGIEGAQIGVPVGMIAGFAVAAVLLPTIGTVLLGGALVGAGAGALIGGAAGAATHADDVYKAARLEHLPLEPGQVLVFVRTGADDVRMWEDEEEPVDRRSLEFGLLVDEVQLVFDRHGAEVLRRDHFGRGLEDSTPDDI